MKWLIVPLLFGLIYWISGTGIEQRWKAWLKAHHLWRVAKELVRRKNLMTVALAAVLSTYTTLPWWEIALCAIAFWGIHFFGWFENRWMSIVRGLIASVPLIFALFFTNGSFFFLRGSAILGLCIAGYHSAWYLRGEPFDPHISWLDWWWVMSFYIGAMIGLGVCVVI